MNAASTSTITGAVDIDDLRGKVRDMYRQVALNPEGEFHFELGRGLAEKLGYPAADLNRIPEAALASFAGVGFYFDLAALEQGERVLDLGSGSGTDTFVAAAHVGGSGHVVGVDMTREQIEKAEALASEHGVSQVEFRRGLIEEIPVEDESIDCVISNGVINLCADKEAVFAEVARVLRPGGRLALSDIVADVELPLSITCDATLWASCIGGAAQIERYRGAIEAAGLEVVTVRENPAYRFLTRSAVGAGEKYGVRSVSVQARKAAR